MSASHSSEREVPSYSQFYLHDTSATHKMCVSNTGIFLILKYYTCIEWQYMYIIAYNVIVFLKSVLGKINID